MVATGSGAAHMLGWSHEVDTVAALLERVARHQFERMASILPTRVTPCFEA